eukprot:TRINITY_DN53224_c0_g1_i1.p1 TRINITY_DN53224_c0_g1~~TRINITY_DN53224_c0_g1_i1.p1  ORF type:complete len:551 (-),score=118.99 TRINITY_DN53224_c0_g1_i1:41-1666(-)
MGKATKPKETEHTPAWLKNVISRVETKVSKRKTSEEEDDVLDWDNEDTSESETEDEIDHGWYDDEALEADGSDDDNDEEETEEEEEEEPEDSEPITLQAVQRADIIRYLKQPEKTLAGDDDSEEDDNQEEEFHQWESEEDARQGAIDMVKELCDAPEKIVVKKLAMWLQPEGFAKLYKVHVKNLNAWLERTGRSTEHSSSVVDGDGEQEYSFDDANTTAPPKVASKQTQPKQVDKTTTKHTSKPTTQPTPSQSNTKQTKKSNTTNPAPSATTQTSEQKSTPTLPKQSSTTPVTTQMPSAAKSTLSQSNPKTTPQTSNKPTRPKPATSSTACSSSSSLPSKCTTSTGNGQQANSEEPSYPEFSRLVVLGPAAIAALPTSTVRLLDEMKLLMNNYQKSSTCACPKCGRVFAPTEVASLIQHHDECLKGPHKNENMAVQQVAEPELCTKKKKKKKKRSKKIPETTQQPPDNTPTTINATTTVGNTPPASTVPPKKLKKQKESTDEAELEPSKRKGKKGKKRKVTATEGPPTTKKKRKKRAKLIL